MLLGKTHMRTHPRNYILTAVSALAALLVCPALQANSALTITGNYSGTYGGIGGVGPYLATLDDVANIPVFCLDENRNTQVGTEYSGYFNHPVDQLDTSGQVVGERQEEAAFLAAYALNLRSPNLPLIDLGGPVSIAIWQLMGTQLSPPTGQGAVGLVNYYINMAKVAKADGSITPQFLSTVYIWKSVNWGNPEETPPQRFLIVTPEPGTLVFLGTGLMLMALSRIRRRR